MSILLYYYCFARCLFSIILYLYVCSYIFYILYLSVFIYILILCIWVISPIIDKRLYLTLFDLATTSWVFPIT